jgi:hypothetical protein
MGLQNGMVPVYVRHMIEDPYHPERIEAAIDANECRKQLTEDERIVAFTVLEDAKRKYK